MMEEDRYAYDADYAAVTVPVERYNREFRDAERFLECCRNCGNYGKNWACPPHVFDVERYVTAYRNASLIAVRITPRRKDLGIEEASELLRRERHKLEQRLLRLERETGGRMFGFSGRCYYCGEEECARIQGNPCRHPELVRPSLEACGYNLALTAEKLLGMEMKWGSDGRLPEYLVLVGGVFHDKEEDIWAE